MNFHFLIATRLAHETNLRILIVETLADVLEANNNDFDEGAAGRMFQLTHVRMGEQSADNDGEPLTHALVAFTIDLPDETTQTEFVIVDFVNALAAPPHLFHVLKFDDPLLQAELAKRATEIFALEMKLRRVLSLIYVHANQHADPYDLLHDESVQPMNKAKPLPAQMKAAAENQFFHLTFGQYVGLNQRPGPKLPEMIEVLRVAERYEDYRQEVLRSPIEHEDDVVLLAGLKERMDAIEQMRNCVAHNRRPTRGISDNYDNARPLLDKLLDDYLTTWEILEPREHDHELHWETAAREAVEHAMEFAEWDETKRTITFDHVDAEPPQSTTVANREELEVYLCGLASAAFYQNSPWEDGESVFEYDDYEYIGPVLDKYETRIAELFDT